MSLIVDASVAVPWLIREDGSDRARSILARGHTLIAPEMLLAEAGNAFFKRVIRNAMSAEHAVEALRAVRIPFSDFVSTSVLIETAARISYEFRHPVYDCLYVALALRTDCGRLATLDRRMMDVAARAGVVCHNL
ncbi:type II toxin-antitoxin system VapC family toxin [Salinarimonas chemoclinalis]|uniref:type II toxin-antitoxin system VapC family toxin n=1 Tax=Salinarimonas chemoclinalis TaxID=3241599 RepID=UPI003558E145